MLLTAIFRRNRRKVKLRTTSLDPAEFDRDLQGSGRLPLSPWRLAGDLDIGPSGL